VYHQTGTKARPGRRLLFEDRRSGFFCVRVDNSDNNLLETYGSYDGWRTVVRRGFRADKYVATYKFKWSTPCKPGFVVRWVRG